MKRRFPRLQGDMSFKSKHRLIWSFLMWAPQRTVSWPSTTSEENWKRMYVFCTWKYFSNACISMLLGRYEYFSVWSLMKIYSYAVAILVNESCLGVYVHLWIWYMYIHTCLSILRGSKNLPLSGSSMSFFFTHRVIPTPSHVQIFLQKTLFSDTC